jgi:rare lipoprotein A
MKNYLKLFCCAVSILFICKDIKAQTLTGTASFYANKFNGRKTATGAIFSNNGLTCACNKLKLGTKVKVTNLRNGKSIILTVNDRLAANNNRVVDVTERAAKELGYYNAGLTKVSVEVIQKKNEINNQEITTSAIQADSTQLDTLKH